MIICKIAVAAPGRYRFIENWAEESLRAALASALKTSWFGRFVCPQKILVLLVPVTAQCVND